MKFYKRYKMKNWFWIALLIVVFFGYNYGKDRALRDNVSVQSNDINDSRLLENYKSIRPDHDTAQA